MLWEIGEHVKNTLDLFGVTEDRIRRWCGIFACWCEQRRTWLNEIGEGVWAYLDPHHYHRQQGLFLQIVSTSLDGYVLSEGSICDIVSQNIRGLSPHTTCRWLTRLVRLGYLSEMNMNGQRWLSLR